MPAGLREEWGPQHGCLAVGWDPHCANACLCFYLQSLLKSSASPALRAECLLKFCCLQVGTVWVSLPHGVSLK